MLGFLSLCLLAICSGFQESVPSSVMYGEKPILRLGPGEPDAAVVVTAPPELQEPAWVSALRENIKSVVKTKGFLNSHKDIKNLIDDANKEINPKHGDALRTLENDPNKKGALKPEPQWEKELKQYIKTLMSQYGKSTVANFINPVVKSIEKNYDLTIHDVDVNPYGEIFVKWTPKKQRKPHSPDRHLHQYSRRDEYEDRR